MKTKHFNIKELVNPNIYKRYGDSSWKFLNPLILNAIDTLREGIGSPIIINDWQWGGNYQDSGMREVDSSIGALYSMHKFGCAMDLKFPDSSVDVVYDYILDNEEYWYNTGVRRLENIKHTPTWLHIDCANTHLNGKIHVFNV
jgi:hypothetical protein